MLTKLVHRYLDFLGNVHTQNRWLSNVAIGCSENIQIIILYYADSYYGALKYMEQESEEKD